MSVASTNPLNAYVGNGGQVAFDFSFKVIAATDVLVYVETGEGTDEYDLKVYGTDYTVAANPTDENGTVTMTVAPALGVKIKILRSTEMTQPSRLPLEEKMPARVIENALDKLTLMVQELRTLFDLPFTPGPSPSVPTNIVKWYEGPQAERPAVMAEWAFWYSTDTPGGGQLEMYVPLAGKWFLIG